VENDVATRRGADVTSLRNDRLINALIKIGFLTTREDTVMITQEKLFEHWPRLHRWLVNHRDKLALRRQAEHAARQPTQRGLSMDLGTAKTSTACLAGAKQPEF